MKLIKLEMQAFGPFKDNVVIDFDNFEQNSLFLITGKTGSGKTTIFDAISYALFGETTGAFRKPENLRSQYASSEADTLVKLLFSSNNKKYLVTRGPSYQREGKKTKKQPISILESIDEGKMLGEKASDINKQIEAILGFNAIQFKQIVVLPQGEFIKILNSSSKDRLALLSSILNVDIYNKMQNEIKKDFDEIATKVATSKSIKDSILNTYNVEKLDELEEIYNKKNIELTEASTIRLKSIKSIDELKQKIEKITQNNKNITHYTELNNELKQLLNNEALYKEALIKIVVLEKVKEISPIFQDYNKLIDSINQANDELNMKNSKLKEVNPNNESLDELKKSYEEAAFKLNELEKENIKIREDIKQYNNEITKINKANNDIFDYTNKITFNERNCFLKKEEKLKLDGKLSFNNKVIDAYDPTLLLKYNNIYDAINNNIRVANDIKKNELQIDKAKTVIKENNITLEELTKLKNAKEILLELAGLEKYSYLLKDNEACPLCGSISHPNIIKAHNINKEDINKIVEEINKVNNEIINNTTLINTLGSNNELLKAQIKEEFLTYSLDEYKEKINFENKKKSEADKAKLDLEALNKNITKANEAIEGYNTEITKANEAIKGLKANILASNNTLDEILNKYKLENIEALDALNDSNSNLIIINNNSNILLKNKIEAISNIITELDKINVSILKDKASLEEKKNILADFKLENKDLSPRIYTKDDLNEYNTLISYKNDYLEKMQRLTGSIETIKKVINSYEIIDISAYNTKLSEENKKYDEINIIYEGLLGRIESLKNDISRYKKLEEASKNDFEKYDMINELYQLTTGKTSGINKINLEAFVLAKILDDILVFTNNYLLRFTDRRYLLLRDDSAGASDRGLDLSITDNYTGLKRGVGSLSGGETFMTCLALALGTSEYISNKAGGISLENIFVDEGFGSLDAESLDRAIETLLELACNGKMIGIISHVEELKLRINQTIEVNKTKSGSTLKINC